MFIHLAGAPENCAINYLKAEGKNEAETRVFLQNAFVGSCFVRIADLVNESVDVTAKWDGHCAIRDDVFASKSWRIKGRRFCENRQLK